MFRLIMVFDMIFEQEAFNKLFEQAPWKWPCHEKARIAGFLFSGLGSFGGVGVHAVPVRWWRCFPKAGNAIQVQLVERAVFVDE